MGRYGAENSHIQTYGFPEGLDPHSHPDLPCRRTCQRETIYRRGDPRAVDDLDHILVQLWESNGVHTHILYTTEEEKREACKYIGALLPGMTKKGIVEMVDDDILF